jgi:hypothetical protein
VINPAIARWDAGRGGFVNRQLLFYGGKRADGIPDPDLV